MNCCENPGKKYIFVFVRVTPKTELSKCAAAMMHILIVKILFYGPVNGMTDQLLAQQQAACWWPQLLPIKPTATIYSHRRSSVSRERSYKHWYALHCIVLYATTSRSRDYDGFAKTYIHSAHPTHHLTLTLSPLRIHVRVVSSFNLCLLVLGSGLVQIGVGVVSTCVYWFWVLENLTLGSINFLGNHH